MYVLALPVPIASLRFPPWITWPHRDGSIVGLSSPDNDHEPSQPVAATEADEVAGRPGWGWGNPRSRLTWRQVRPVANEAMRGIQALQQTAGA